MKTINNIWDHVESFNIVKHKYYNKTIEQDEIIKLFDHIFKDILLPHRTYAGIIQFKKELDPTYTLKYILNKYDEIKFNTHLNTVTLKDVIITYKTIRNALPTIEFNASSVSYTSNEEV